MIFENICLDLLTNIATQCIILIVENNDFRIQRVAYSAKVYPLVS